MATRSTRILFHNQTNYSLVKIEEGLQHGEWTNPWKPPDLISPNNNTEWRSESDGLATGTEGSVKYGINNGEDASVYIHWDNPFSGTNKYHQFTGDKFEVFHTGGSGDNATVEFTLMDSVPHFVPGFRPDNNGFHFSNSGFGNVPYSLPPLRGSILDFKYGNAKNGLCGGMVYAVRDYYEAGGVIPKNTTAPSGEGDPLFI